MASHTESKEVALAQEAFPIEKSPLDLPLSEDRLETASSVNEKKLLRKLDLALLPPLTLLYLLSFLDRSNS